MEPKRLNKFIALQFGISRRQADEMISSGKVFINDKVASLGVRFLKSDEIKVNNKVVSSRLNSKQYILLNKPKGYVCSRRKQGKNPTIYAILPEKIHHLKPVGRLDKDSSGLLILSNDGDFAFRMTHPKFQKNKEYLVRIDRPLEPIHQQMIADFGINLPDGKSKLGLERLDESRMFWRVLMSEGRNRQIRRTFAGLGYDVVYLHRVAFGAYILPENLNFGDFIEVSGR